MIARADSRSWPIGFSSTTRDNARGEVVGADVATDRPVEAGRDREVEDPDPRRVEPFGQRLPTAVRAHRVKLGVAQALEETLRRLGFERCRIDMLLQRRGGALPEALVIELGARGADDPRVLRHLAVAEAPVEGRQQLPQREIAGRAEDDEVEGGDGDDLRGHVATPRGTRRRPC